MERLIFRRGDGHEVRKRLFKFKYICIYNIHVSSLLIIGIYYILITLNT